MPAKRRQGPRGSFDLPLLVAALALAALGVVMFAIVDVIERRLIPWHVSHRSDLIVGTP